MRHWRIFFVALFLSGCTNMCSGDRRDMSPEQVVEAYLDIALNMTEIAQKDLLYDYTTGNLRESIEQAADEVIQRAYVERRYEILSYSVVERRDRTPRETEITFQLEYNDLSKELAASEIPPKVTTENTVSVVKKDQVWMIRDVLGNKTSIDFPVSEDSKITAKAP
jgi:hypothetical protein